MRNLQGNTNINFIADLINKTNLTTYFNEYFLIRYQTSRLKYNKKRYIM